MKDEKESGAGVGAAELWPPVPPQEQLHNALPGGTLSTYLEEGFPVCRTSPRMLRLLGYEDEASFLADIDGKFVNCIHPDDRVWVDTAVMSQLQTGGEYTAEYRLRGRDGVYVWVYDLGRRTVTADGRTVLSSVCVDITQRRQTMNELRTLYNNIPGAVFRCRAEPRYTVMDANDFLFDFLGYSRAEFAALGNSMVAVTHPEDQAHVAQTLTLPREAGETLRLELRLVRRDGRLRWVSLQAQAFTELDGSRYFYCVFVDITDAKILQRQVRELYDKELAYFAQSSAEGSIQGRLNLTQDYLESYLTPSDEAVAAVGVSYGDAIRSLMEVSVDKAYGQRMLRMMEREQVRTDYAAGRTEYRFDYLRRRRDGGVFWANTTFRSCLNPETGDIILFFYTRDFTETKLQEQLLSRIAGLNYEVIADVNILRDTHRLVAFRDDQEDRVAYRGSFQAELRRVSETYMDEKARAEYLKKLDYGYMTRMLGKQDSYSFSLEMRPPGKAARVKRLQVFYISRELGRVCVLRTDVTDVVRQARRQQNDLAAALTAAQQASAAKSDFLSRMSHELRTPMNAIMGMSTVAAGALDDRERMKDCLEKIDVSSRFLLSLLNDILDMSHLESGKLLLKSEPLIPARLIGEVNSICSGQAAAKGVEYECAADPLLDGEYVGDEGKLQQVLINVLSNAVKFTDAGGKVTFTASRLRRTANGVVVRFVVQDTGRGIGADFIPHLFEPFSQESTGNTALYGGTGLGLAISKSIVDMMNGRIAVDSTPGEGSWFTIDIPLALPPQALPAQTSGETGGEGETCPAANADFTGKRVLLAEDNAINTELAIFLLEDRGFRVDTAKDGQEAVELFRRSAVDTYSAVLMDIRMPRMDGLAASAAIRALDRGDAGRVPIIAMTANASPEEQARSRAAGMDAHLAKPVEPQRLYRTLYDFIFGKEVKGNVGI